MTGVPADVWLGCTQPDTQYGSRTLLADQGNLGVPGESCALVEPS